MRGITISREYGSGGDQIAQQVCGILGFRYFDKTLMAQVAKERGLSDNEIVDFSDDDYRARGLIDTLFRRSVPVGRTTIWTTTTRGEESPISVLLDQETAVGYVASTVRAAWEHGAVVVVGRGGQAILADKADVLRVRIVAPLETRLEQVMHAAGLDRGGALSLIRERDRARAEYLRRFYKVDWADPALYHLTINAALLGADRAAELIADAARRLQQAPSQVPVS